MPSLDATEEPETISSFSLLPSAKLYLTRADATQCNLSGFRKRIWHAQSPTFLARDCPPSPQRRMLAPRRVRVSDTLSEMWVNVSVKVDSTSGPARPLQRPQSFKTSNGYAMRGRLQIRATRWTFVDRAGNYSVVVANSMGSVTSAPVVLTVNCALTRPPRMAGRFPNIPICRVSRRTPS